MTNSAMPPGPGAFEDLREQIEALRSGADHVVIAGHRDLGPALWLSCDPAGRAEMTCRSSDGDAGILLRLEAGDSGAWAALGMRLPVEVLRKGRYLGLLVRLQTGDVFSFTPSLRYFMSEGINDVSAPVPVILAGGPREHLSYIPIDSDLLEQASGCELNLFFHSDSFVAHFSAIEPLLIL